MSSPEPPERGPRWATPRAVDRRTHGGALDQVASVLGWMLFLWQRLAADVALEVDPLTKAYRYRTVGISVARQNGKTLLVVVRIALELIRPNRTVIYTAQNRDMARRQWEKHCDLLMSRPVFAREVVSYVKANGRECLTLRNKSIYLIVTPNEDAARSLTVDLAIIDEAYSQRSMAVVGAMNPTMITRPSAQLWILSNAGTFASMLFRHYTDVGRASVDNPRSRMCWLEYASAQGAELLDRDAWADANPSIGLEGGPLYGALESVLLDVGEDVFRREHMNLWPDLGSLAGIDAVAWAACYSPELVPGDHQLHLGLDVTPARDLGCLVSAADVGGRTPLEVVEHTSDLRHLITRTCEVAKRHNATVVIDRPSPAGSYLPALERANVNVRLIPVTEVSRACGEFHDAVLHALIAHRSDPRLADAVLSAGKRRFTDGWVWDRRAGTDISTLMAATLARWGVVAANELEPHVW